MARVVLSSHARVVVLVAGLVVAAVRLVLLVARVVAAEHLAAEVDKDFVDVCFWKMEKKEIIVSREIDTAYVQGFFFFLLHFSSLLLFFFFLVTILFTCS